MAILLIPAKKQKPHTQQNLLIDTTPIYIFLLFPNLLLFFYPSLPFRGKIEPSPFFYICYCPASLLNLQTMVEIRRDFLLRQFLRSSKLKSFERSRMAERGGFEPPVPCGTTAFEAAPINQTLASLLLAITNLYNNLISDPNQAEQGAWFNL
jgi:hypothetical protein